MGKKKNEAPKMIRLSEKEADALLERIKSQSLTKKDTETIEATFAMVFWIQQRLARAKLSIRRLQNLFGFSSEAGKLDKKTDGADSTAEELSAPDSPEKTTNKKQNTLPAKFDPNQNHGRLGADEYTGCEEVEVPLGNDFADGKCPQCLECHTDSKLGSEKPSVVVILESQPIIAGAKYNLERVRCSLCQTYFTADLPEEAGNGKRYQPSCATGIAINHYYAGMPFNRIEMLQQAQGVPVSDSTQYDLVNALYQTVVYAVFVVLRRFAANGTSLSLDDTPGRILEQTRKNKLGFDKKAVHSTAIISEHASHKIYLFSTNTKTAGAELKSLLESRDSSDDFMTMSDASSSNFYELDESLLCKWIIALCLAHSRRRFVELMEDGADEIKFVLAVMGQAYHHERYCKQNKLSDEARLAYHQKHSKPIMEGMKVWLNNQLLYRSVEPNSALGEAIIYLLKYWHGLTQFYRAPGALLDNNLCEQAIKVFIRYRKNSLFYRTPYSAGVGNAMMSVIHTAAQAGANVFDYLNKLQDYSDLVNESPEDWLPWNYLQTIESLADKAGSRTQAVYASLRHDDTS